MKSYPAIQLRASIPLAWKPSGGRSARLPWRHAQHIIERRGWKGKKAMVYAFKNIHFRIPAAMYRLAVVGSFAGLLATAVVYSRAEKVASDIDPMKSKQAFQQLKDRPQAEARFIPIPKEPVTSEGNELEIAEIASSPSQPRRRPFTPGYYYELVRLQGDGVEGEYVLVERKCIPGVDMPQPCYLPKNGRRDFPIRRE